MSLFGNMVCIDLKDRKKVSPVINDIKCDKKEKLDTNIDKSIIERFEDTVNMVFSNMKKRGSHTDLRIDYPWLTI